MIDNFKFFLLPALDILLYGKKARLKIVYPEFYFFRCRGRVCWNEIGRYHTDIGWLLPCDVSQQLARLHHPTSQVRVAIDVSINFFFRLVKAIGSEHNFEFSCSVLSFYLFPNHEYPLFDCRCPPFLSFMSTFFRRKIEISGIRVCLYWQSVPLT